MRSKEEHVVRRFPRMNETCSMLVRTINGQRVEGLVKTGDISLGGCEFTVDQELGLGTVLDLLISIDRRVLRVRGQVAYERASDSNGVSVGVEFVRMGRREREMLESLFDLEGLLNGSPERGRATASGAVA